MHHKHSSKMVPMISLHTFFKYVEQPVVSEGFTSVVNVNFIPDLFDNKEDEEFYKQSQV